MCLWWGVLYRREYSCLWKSEEGASLPVVWAIYDCVDLCGCWERNESSPRDVHSLNYCLSSRPDSSSRQSHAMEPWLAQHSHRTQVGLKITASTSQMLESQEWATSMKFSACQHFRPCNRSETYICNKPEPPKGNTSNPMNQIIIIKCVDSKSSLRRQAWREYCLECKEQWTASYGLSSCHLHSHLRTQVESGRAEPCTATVFKPAEQSVVLGFLSQGCRVKGIVLPIVRCPLSHRPPTTMDFPSGEQNRQLPNYFWKGFFPRNILFFICLWPGT